MTLLPEIWEYCAAMVQVRSCYYFSDQSHIPEYRQLRRQQSTDAPCQEILHCPLYHAGQLYGGSQRPPDTDQGSPSLVETPFHDLTGWRTHVQDFEPNPNRLRLRR